MVRGFVTPGRTEGVIEFSATAENRVDDKLASCGSVESISEVEENVR
jgi:hypothetical protein